MDWKQWILNNWDWILPTALIVADKIVAVSPTKYDDLILSTLRGALKDRTKKVATTSMLAVFLALPLVGCSTTGTIYTPPPVCSDNADSAILTYLPKPLPLRTAIVGGVLASVQAGYVSQSAVLKTCADARVMLEGSSTYSGVVAWIKQEIEPGKIQAVLSLVNATGVLDYLAGLTGDVSPCDKALLLRLIEAVEEAVE
jgi:hypothetical protein